jgi:hypothetical protein
MPREVQKCPVAGPGPIAWAPLPARGVATVQLTVRLYDRCLATFPEKIQIHHDGSTHENEKYAWLRARRGLPHIEDRSGKQYPINHSMAAKKWIAEIFSATWASKFLKSQE